MHFMLETFASVSMGNQNYAIAVTSAYVSTRMGKKSGWLLLMVLLLAVHAVQFITARSHSRIIDITIA
jgi:hypothetical protein